MAAISMGSKLGGGAAVVVVLVVVGGLLVVVVAVVVGGLLAVVEVVAEVVTGTVVTSPVDHETMLVTNFGPSSGTA